MAKKPDDKSTLAASGPLFRRDDYLPSDQKPREAATEAAPEVSQGAWRERAFIPRGVMAPEALVAGLEQALALAAERPFAAGASASALGRDWLPLLRQAVEQAGGDGLDAWLLTALKPPGRAATTAFCDALAGAFGKVRAAADAAALAAAGKELIALVQGALAQKKRVSFKVLEKELDGKLEVDELLAVRFATVAELEARAAEVSATLDSLRAQVKAQPGARPDGIYANHARLKAELRVIKAELSLRGA